MKISIITVCLNSAKTIRKALDSVRNQTNKDIELIIIDGVSTDETLQIVAEYKDIVTTVVSEKDKGIYDAMNKGIDIAKGEVIYFLNSDDELLSSSILLEVNKQFESDNTLEMLYGDVVLRNANSDRYRRNNHITKANVLHTGICHQAIFARKSLFDSAGKFNTAFKIYADFDWVIRVFRNNHNKKYLPRVVAIFNSGGASMSDPTYNLRERLLVQHQYEKGLVLWVGHYLERIRYHLLKLTGLDD